MKLYLETDDGVKHPITEIKSISEGSASDILFFMCNKPITRNDGANFEMRMSDKTYRRCILVPPFISSIFGVDNNVPKMMD